MQRPWASLLLVWVALSCGRARAHDVRGTVILLDLGIEKIDAEIQLPLQELQSALELPATWRGPLRDPATPSQLRGYVAAHFGADTPDGRSFGLTVHDVSLQRIDDGDSIVAHATLAAPIGASARVFDLRTDLIVHRVASHNLFVFVRHDAQSGSLDQEPKLLGMMHYQNKLLRVDRRDGSLWRAFSACFGMGARHIAEGIDHLMFLLVLLLPAGLLASAGRWQGAVSVRASALQIAQIITAFTVGHSLTLLIGALARAPVAPRVVEVLIAVSILVSAVHALRPLFPGREAWIALGFGLVHGLAFASVLQGFTVDRVMLATGVLGFNLGIEAMQLVVVAMTVPWLFVLRRRSHYDRVRIAGASLAALAACGWIVERAFDLRTPLSSLADAIASSQ